MRRVRQKDKSTGGSVRLVLQGAARTSERRKEGAEETKKEEVTP